MLKTWNQSHISLAVSNSAETQLQLLSYTVHPQRDYTVSVTHPITLPHIRHPGWCCLMLQVVTALLGGGLQREGE